MAHTRHVPATDRLSELVAHLSGAPLERSRVVVRDAGARHRSEDHLFQVADALVRHGCGVPAPKRNASMPL